MSEAGKGRSRAGPAGAAASGATRADAPVVETPPGDPHPAEGGSGTFVWMAGGLALLHAVFGLLVYEPILFPGGDNAGYMILGEALRGGEGYRDLYLPGSPLHAKYPPLFPSMLAVLGLFGGVQLFKLAMLACTSLAVCVTALLGRRLVGEGPALVAALLVAVNPTLLEYGHYVLSEAPFVLATLLALWAFERDERAAPALAMVAAAAAFGIRTAGMTVLLAVPLGWLARRQLRRAAWGGVAAAAALIAWGAYQRWAAPDQPGYLRELVLVDPYDPAAGAVGAAGLAVRAARNLWAYASQVVPQTALGAQGPPSGLLIGVGLVLAGLALAGWALRARRRAGAAELFVLLYVGLIALWPEVWTDRRFLLPLLPLLILMALGFVAARGPRARRWAPLGIALAIGAPCLIWVIERVPERLDCLAAYRSGAPCDLPAYASLYAAARWAAEHTPPEAVIANRKPTLFYWYSRRRGDLYPYAADPATVMAGLERMGADYVVVDQVSGTTGRYLVPAIRANPTRFEPVYEGGAPPSFILRLLPAPATAQ